MATAAILKILLKRCISIRNIIIYLETKFRPNRRIFVLWRPFLVQNHRVNHSKPKWSPYGAAYLTPSKIHFHWNLFIFEFLTIFFYFYIGGHLEIFKKKEHNFEWWSFFVSSFKRMRCTFELKKNCTLVTMATAAILNLFNPNSCHTLRWIFLESFMRFDERNPKQFVIPLFCIYGSCGKVCPTDSDFFGLSRSIRCRCGS